MAVQILRLVDEDLNEHLTCPKSILDGAIFEPTFAGLPTVGRWKT
jgi:hypothetical protein